MDPAIIVFGFGVGFLVGLTGMGGGSLMTPLLILIFGISPTTAIGTDISYAAVTKTVGAWRHLKLKTVNVGSSLDGGRQHPVGGRRRLGDRGSSSGATATTRRDRLRDPRRRLLVIGAATLIRGFFLHKNPGAGRLRAAHRGTRSPRSASARLTGFVIGISSAGSGVLIAIMLIAVYRLTPQKVVGTDVRRSR